MIRVVIVVAATALASSCGSAQDPHKAATRLDLAKGFLNNGNLEAAEQEANRALAYQHTNEEAENVLGLVYLQRATSDFFLLEIDNCLTGVDADAIRLDFDAHLATADQHFARATRMAPDFGDAWANRGAIAIHLEDYAAAVEDLTTALGLPGRLLDIDLVRARLGWAYFHQGNLPRAAKELLQAYQFRPGACVATYRLGRVYFERKEWEKATDKFREVSEQASCASQQEAHLYLMKSLNELHAGASSDLMEQARARCLAVSPESCIAAQCRSLDATVLDATVDDATVGDATVGGVSPESDDVAADR